MQVPNCWSINLPKWLDPGGQRCFGRRRCEGRPPESWGLKTPPPGASLAEERTIPYSPPTRFAGVPVNGPKTVNRWANPLSGPARAAHLSRVRARLDGLELLG